MKFARLFIVAIAALSASCAGIAPQVTLKPELALDPVVFILSQTLQIVRTYKGPNRETVLYYGIMRIADARKVYLARGKNDRVQADQIERSENTLQAQLYTLYMAKYNEIGDIPRAQEAHRTACIYAAHSFISLHFWEKPCEDALRNARI